MKRLRVQQLAMLAEANALALELAIPPASFDGVVANFRILGEHAARVMAFDPGRDRQTDEIDR